MAPDVFPGTIRGSRGTGEDWFVGEISAEVRRQLRRRLIPAGRILLERLHRDPVQIAAQQIHQLFWISPAHPGGCFQLLAVCADPRARTGWLLLRDHSLDLPPGTVADFERPVTSQHLVEQDTK